MNDELHSAKQGYTILSDPLRVLSERAFSEYLEQRSSEKDSDCDEIFLVSNKHKSIAKSTKLNLKLSDSNNKLNHQDLETNNEIRFPEMIKRMPDNVIELKHSDIPEYVMVNQEYSVNFLLANGDQPIQGGNVCLKAEILLDSDFKTLGDEYYSLNSKSLVFDKTGSATLRFTIKALSTSLGNKRFMITLHAIEGSSNPLTEFLKPWISPGIICVSQRLAAKFIPPPENSYSFDILEGIWYKDESGKDKSIDILIELLDSTGQRVINRNVPLRATLVYHGTGEIVLRQDILQILPDSSMSINSLGETYVKFRLNDVSKNHQRQSFSILWTPTNFSSQIFTDISPITSEPIEVRSKRTKRVRENGPEEVHFNSASNKPKLKIETKPSTISQLVPRGNMHRIESSITPKNDEIMARPASISLKAIGEFNDSIRDNNTNSDTAELAIEVIRKWTNRVVTDLNELKWRQIGVERTTHDVIYDMKNPNSVIDELVNQFDSVSKSIETVLNAIKRSPTGMSNNLMNENLLHNTGYIAEQQNNSSILKESAQLRKSMMNVSTLESHSRQKALYTHTRSNTIDTEGDWGDLIQNIETSTQTRLEKNVFAVNSTPIVKQSNQSPILQSLEGTFCAFDSNNSLIGFYREMQDQFNVTVIAFLPLSQNGMPADGTNIQLPQYEISSLEEEHLHKLRNNSPDIFTIDKYQHDLEKMKQEVMVHFWLAEVSLLDL